MELAGSRATCPFAVERHFAHNRNVAAEQNDADPLANLGREIELLATTALTLADSSEEIFDRAAVLRDNAMGIIYDGDGSSDEERIGRLLALVPALLTVVDEARDTIGRLRDLAGEADPEKAISPWDAAGRSAPDRPDWNA